MTWKIILPIAGALLCGVFIVAGAQQKSANPPAAGVAAKSLTRQQFQALPADAKIEINGEQISKSAYQARNLKGLQDAANKLPEFRAQAKAKSDAQRKTILDKRAASLAEANKKVEDEVNKLVTADAAKYGANWEARKKQAADLLDKAAKAQPLDQAALAKQAADLLKPAAK